MADEREPRLTRLLAVVPWEAAGPGWRNDGITAYFEDTYGDGSTRVREETIQGVDAPPDLEAIRKVGLLVRRELEPLFGGQQAHFRPVSSPVEAGESPASLSLSAPLVASHEERGGETQGGGLTGDEGQR
jgi:hypothetical protein